MIYCWLRWIIKGNIKEISNKKGDFDEYVVDLIDYYDAMCLLKSKFWLEITFQIRFNYIKV